MPDSAAGLDILYVGTLPPHEGGAAIVGAQLLRELAARGHVVRALAPITSEARQAGADFAATHPLLRLKWFHVPRFNNAPDLPPDDDFTQQEREQIATRLPAMIAERRPHVIVIGRESFVRHVPEIARASAVPSLMLVHGDPTRGLIDGTYPGPLTDQLLARYHQVQHIVTPGRHMAEGLRRIGLRRVSVIPNGVDLAQFTPRPKDGLLLRALGIRDDCLILMHASKLEPGKRAQDIVDSAKHVLALRRNLVYLIVGHGPSRDALEQACLQKGVAERFRFVGWVDHRLMPRYINLADVVIMPSEAETQALVYLETQACARLLLASDIPAAREVVADDETGLLFAMGDVDDLTAKTLQAIDLPWRRSAIGNTARERVQRHALAAVTTRYEALLRRIACHSLRHSDSDE